jgi:outer membrane lipoprotein-sorting protein
VILFVQIVLILNVYGCTDKIYDAINKNLNNIKTLKGFFTEEDNTIQQGTFFIKKPKKIKIDYEKLSIFVEGDLITYYDKELNEITQMNKNIIGISLLAQTHINIVQDLKPTQCTISNNIIQIIPEQQKDLNVMLFFSNKTYDLIMTKINNKVVKFYKLSKNITIPDDIFDVKDPNF